MSRYTVGTGTTKMSFITVKLYRW